MKVTIRAIEYHLPDSTEDGNILLEANPEWRIEEIEAKTGIQKRYIADPGETAIDLAELAIRKMFGSRIRQDQIDCLIYVSQSPEDSMPIGACVLQHRLGLKNSCMAFDVNLGCSGFVYGLAIAGSLIEARVVERALLVCSDTYTKYISSSDRTCRPIFSDGASVTLVEASDKDCIGPFAMGTDGAGQKELAISLTASHLGDRFVTSRSLFMDGAKVFMFTMNMVPHCITRLLTISGRSLHEIDLYVFHQASKVVIDSIVRRLAISKEKVFVNYREKGNTVSSSIPVALRDAVDQKRIKNGDLVMLVGFGYGYSWGACLMKWEGEV